MKHLYSKRSKHCRWCGKVYEAEKPIDRDGFHNTACKQAHYRAYKKYVTVEKISVARARGRPVTQKKRKKKTS